MVAIQYGHVEVVKMLTDYGADVNVSHDKSRLTPLMHAASVGHIIIARALVKKGALVDKVDARGYTALMFAAERGHAKVVEILLQNRAKTKPKNECGQDALEISQRSHHSGVEKLLRAKTPWLELVSRWPRP